MESLIDVLKHMVCKLNIHSRKNKKILVLVRLDAIGDFVLWLDAAKKIRKYYIDYKIIVICNAINYQLATKVPYFDEVIPMDIKRGKDIKYAVYLMAKFLSLHGCTVIQCVRTRYFTMDALVAMIPAYKKIAIDSDNIMYEIKEQKYINYIYDQVIPSDNGWKMELIRNNDFIKEIGITDATAELPFIPPIKLENTNLIEGEYYIIVLGAADMARAWNVYSYVEMARKIYETTGKTCCLVGSEKEIELGIKFEEALKGIKIYNMIGKTQLIEYIELIRNALWVISGDTSAAHIAAAVRTPSVVILGGGHYKRFYPYGIETDEEQFCPKVCFNEKSCYYCNWVNTTDECKEYKNEHGNWECVASVTVEMVLEKVNKIIEENGL